MKTKNPNISVGVFNYFVVLGLSLGFPEVPLQPHPFLAMLHVFIFLS
tara:strand:- start:597 stop:737 length:141 start_codon:yes stop_codon:yes gene_type:complete